MKLGRPYGNRRVYGRGLEGMVDDPSLSLRVAGKVKGKVEGMVKFCHHLQHSSLY